MYYLKITKHNELYCESIDIYIDPIFSESYNYLLNYLKLFILEVMEENYFTYCNDYIEERKFIEELIDCCYNIDDLENKIKNKYLKKRYSIDEFILDFDIKEVKISY